MVRHTAFVTLSKLIFDLYPVDMIKLVTPSSIRITHAAGFINCAGSGVDDDDDDEADGMCSTRMISSSSSVCVNGMRGGYAGLN